MSNNFKEWLINGLNRIIEDRKRGYGDVCQTSGSSPHQPMENEELILLLESLIEDIKEFEEY